MKIFFYIKAIFYLIAVIIIAVLGLSHSFYGLMVSTQNSSIYEIDLNNIENENIRKNRYLNLKNANSVAEPLVFVDQNGFIDKYVYALTPSLDIDHIEAKGLSSKVILETKTAINDFKTKAITGLLKPYWNSIDEKIIRNFEYSGIKISDDAVYLKLDSKPWNWYWHVLIISLAILFFYRMFEALFMKFRKSNSKGEKKNNTMNTMIEKY